VTSCGICVGGGVWAPAGAYGVEMTPVVAGGDTPGNQLLAKKLDGYLMCHQEHTKKVFRTADLYREQFASVPPTPESVIVISPPLDPKTCIDAIATAKTLTPALPALEGAAAQYGAALSEIYLLTSTYDRTKAAQLHPRLISAFEAFDQAQGAMYDQLYTLNRKLHLAQFAVREKKDPDGFEIAIERIQLAAEDLARFAPLPAAALDPLDVKGLRTSLASVEHALQGLNLFEERAPDFDLFKDTRDATLALVVAARQLARRAEDHVAYSDAEKIMIREGNESDVVGSPAALTRAYNELVEPEGHTPK